MEDTKKEELNMLDAETLLKKIHSNELSYDEQLHALKQLEKASSAKSRKKPDLKHYKQLIEDALKEKRFDPIMAVFKAFVDAYQENGYQISYDLSELKQQISKILEQGNYEEVVKLVGCLGKKDQSTNRSLLPPQIPTKDRPYDSYINELAGFVPEEEKDNYVNILDEEESKEESDNDNQNNQDGDTTIAYEQLAFEDDEDYQEQKDQTVEEEIAP